MIWVIGKTANQAYGEVLPLETLISLGAFVDGPSRARLDSFGLQPGSLNVRSCNLCSPGIWDPMEATRNWKMLERHHFKAGDRVLLFGSNVCQVAHIPFVAMSERRRIITTGFYTITALPHPSGRSFWWNCNDNKERFRNYIHGISKVR